jgi:hypothetical protein
MGFKFGGQSALNDLALYLDASNPISYPGSGNVWFDISGRSNHFNLQGSPTISGSALTFNTIPGSNQYATANNTTIGDFGTGSFTIEYVANFPTTHPPNFSAILSNNHGAFHSAGSPGLAGYSLGIGNQTYFQDNGFRANSNSEQFGADDTNRPLKNQITHQVYTIQRGPTNVDTVTGKLYKNSSLTTTITYDMGPTRFLARGLPPEGNSNISNTSFTLHLMRAAANPYYATGSVYLIKMYNRVLTQAEVTNNYNIIRSKYGI